MRSPSAILVSMPWTSMTEPSLGLGILRAVLDNSGIPCRVLHLNLFLLEHLRPTTYYGLANVYALNDFLFSAALDPVLTPRQTRWLHAKAGELVSNKVVDVREHGGIDGVVERLLHLRQHVVPRWLAKWADEIAGSDATLVGLTCMFDQTIASLALAQLLKARAPDKLVVLGGYAVRAPTGPALLRSFPCIDAVCSGEGELVIAALARASAGACALADVPGLLVRQDDGSIAPTSLPGPVEMDEVPTPNYDDFFADLKRLARDHQVDAAIDRLPVENSRGCWWGQVKHCVFCGIHDDDMAYRARSAERVLDSMAQLSSRYGYNAFRFSDYILPHQYYRSLLPALAAQGRPYRITGEIKANVNAERFALLAQAGFDAVQPGIESFSTGVLKQMDKGVTGVQNVHALLLGKQHGITVHYNLLYGLPHDEEADYVAMVEQLPLLYHLDPPSTRLLTQVTRYAPLQVNPARFGLRPARHEASYDLIFSQDFLASSGFDLDDYCYYFERTFDHPVALRRLYRDLDRLVDAWAEQQQRRDVHLTYAVTVDGRLRISDTRREQPVELELTRDESSVLLAALEPTTRGRLARRMPDGLTSEQVELSLARLSQLGLLFEDGASIVALPLPHVNPGAPDDRAAQSTANAGREQA